MKIRIRANSVRFRLTKTEVNNLCEKGYVEEKTPFDEATFCYAVKESQEDTLSASFNNNAIVLHIPSAMLNNWHIKDTVGFYHNQQLKDGSELVLTLEKDFVCMDETVEDQSDNYPNPKAL